MLLKIGLKVASSACLIVAVVGCSRDLASVEPGVALSVEAAPALMPQAARQLRILVVGETRGIGRKVVERGPARGHSMTALARRPERLDLNHERLRVVQGDILDDGSMITVLDGHDAIVTVSVPPGFEPVTLFSEGIRNVLRATSAAGGVRVLAVTGIGAGNSRGHGGSYHDRIGLGTYLRSMYDDKTREVELIRESGTDWKIVRPGFLTDADARTRDQVFASPDGVTSGSICRADVAHFIIAELESPRHRRETLLVSD